MAGSRFLTGPVQEKKEAVSSTSGLVTRTTSAHTTGTSYPEWKKRRLPGNRTNCVPGCVFSPPARVRLHPLCTESCKFQLTALGQVAPPAIGGLRGGKSRLAECSVAGRIRTRRTHQHARSVVRATSVHGPLVAGALPHAARLLHPCLPEMHRLNQTAQHVIGAGSTTDIRTGEWPRCMWLLRAIC